MTSSTHTHTHTHTVFDSQNNFKDILSKIFYQNWPLELAHQNYKSPSVSPLYQCCTWPSRKEGTQTSDDLAMYTRIHSSLDRGKQGVNLEPNF